MTGQYDPTPEQRKAIEAYVKGTLSPLIESVLVKQLGMAAVFLREKIAESATVPQSDAAAPPQEQPVDSTEAGGQTVPALTVREALELVSDLASQEWQQPDGRRMSAAGHDGRRFWFISDDVMRDVREALARNGPAESPRPDEKESAAMEVLRELVAADDACGDALVGQQLPGAYGKACMRRHAAWAAARFLLSSGTTDA